MFFCRRVQWSLFCRSGSNKIEKRFGRACAEDPNSQPYGIILVDNILNATAHDFWYRRPWRSHFNAAAAWYVVSFLSSSPRCSHH